MNKYEVQKVKQVLKCFQFKIKKQKNLYKVYCLENGPPVVDCCLAVYIREPAPSASEVHFIN